MMDKIIEAAEALCKREDSAVVRRKIDLMPDRSSLIEKLVLTLHLNVAERKILGMKPVLESEVATVIKRVLEDRGRFPPHATPWQQGHNVFEGHFLELHSSGRARLWWQRHLATNPYQLAEQRYWDFSDVERAVVEFVRKEWVAVHGGIDGIPITPD
jgi:hypothetical protein